MSISSSEVREAKMPRVEDHERTPVLLITDIGADIDDTEALLVALGSPYLQLVGIVTAVNNGVARAALARGWLRRLGVADSDVPILPSVDPATAACTIPDGWPAPSESALGEAESVTKWLCRRYGSPATIWHSDNKHPLSLPVTGVRHPSANPRDRGGTPNLRTWMHPGTYSSAQWRHMQGDCAS